MPLTEADIERYARQILVPGFGASGQQRIRESRVIVCGEPSGVDNARRVARAVGFEVVAADAQPPVACAIVAGIAAMSSLEEAALSALAGSRCPIVWYALTPSGYRTGVAFHPSRLTLRATAPTRAAAEIEALHAIAAADAVATAVATVLAWPDVEHDYEVEVG
jgi:hypothetical protein